MLIDTSKLIETLQYAQRQAMNLAIEGSSGLTDGLKKRLESLDKDILNVKQFELFAGKITPAKTVTMAADEYDEALRCIEEITRLSNKIRTHILGPEA